MVAFCFLRGHTAIHHRRCENQNTYFTSYTSFGQEFRSVQFPLAYNERCTSEGGCTTDAFISCTSVSDTGLALERVNYSPGFSANARIQHNDSHGTAIDDILQRYR